MNRTRSQEPATERLVLRIPPTQKREVLAHAAHLAITPSAFVRRAIAAEIDRNRLDSTLTRDLTTTKAIAR